MNQAMAEKALLFCWVVNGLCVLVPKKRGEGFLKQPYGHHYDQALSSIENASSCDIHGLDGHLYFDGAPSRAAYVNWDKRPAFEALVLPGLVTHYGMAARRIEQDEFWRRQPNKLAA